MASICSQNYHYELDEGFPHNLQQQRETFLSNLGIPRNRNNDEEDVESSDSSIRSDNQYDYRQDLDCGLSTEKDLSWFEIVQSSGPWDESTRPYFKIDWPTEENEEDERNLTSTTVSTGLSFLDAIPLSGVFALTKLQLPNKNLEDVQILDAYKMLQYVDLSFNNIRDLSPLYQTKHLIVLDASHNCLSNFTPNSSPWFLTYLNLSYNELESVPDVTSMWSLKHLNLSNNKIRRLEHLNDLNYLTYLNVSDNEITVVENVDGPSLLHLNLSGNQIVDCDPTCMKKAILLRLDMSSNLITNFSQLKFVNPSRLRHLNLSSNRLEHFDGLSGLENFKSLRYLKIEGNRLFSVRPDALLHTVGLLPNIKYVDGRRLTRKYRLAAIGSSGDDIVDEMKAYCSQLLRRNCQIPDYGTTSCKYLNYDAPIVVLVGPSGSRKHFLCRYIADNYKKYVVVPTIHTTMYTNFNRDNVDDEFKSMKLCHADLSEFNAILKQGRFLFSDNELGDLYGLREDELTDDSDDRKLRLVPLKIGPAHSLKWLGLNVTFILIMPSNPLDYSELLQTYVSSKVAIRKEAEVLEDSILQKEEPRSSSALHTSSDATAELKNGLFLTENHMLNVKSNMSSNFNLINSSRQTNSINQIDQSIHVMTEGELKWCDDSDDDDKEQLEEPSPVYVPYIDKLKVSQKEKDDMWSLYGKRYDEIKIYNDNIDAFSTVIYVDDVETATSKIMPILVQKYNEYFEMSQYIRCGGSLGKMEMSANRPVMEEPNNFQGAHCDSELSSVGDTQSSLSMPFFSPDTSSLSGTQSSSLTFVGSTEKLLEEPQLCRSEDQLVEGSASSKSPF